MAGFFLGYLQGFELGTTLVLIDDNHSNVLKLHYFIFLLCFLLVFSFRFLKISLDFVSFFSFSRMICCFVLYLFVFCSHEAGEE